MKIQILIYDGFDELDAIGPFEVLRVAARSGADIQVEMVTLDGAESVIAQNGLKAGTTRRFDESADLLLVPGGGWAARSPRGAWAEYQRGIVPQALANWHSAGKPLAAVCTGAMLIARCADAARSPITAPSTIYAKRARRSSTPAWSMMAISSRRAA